MIATPVGPVMTRGTARSISNPSSAKPPKVAPTAFTDASTTVERSPIANHVRVRWFLGGRPFAFLQTSFDLQTWDEVRQVTEDGFDDFEMIAPRQFWRLRLTI